MGRKKGKKAVEPVAATLQTYTSILLDVAICAYILLILVVMPLYHQEGYTHIGTDKARFFADVSTGTAKIVLPLLALSLFLSAKKAWHKRGNASRLWIYLKENLSATDVFALAYGASLLISYLFSRYKGDARWGVAGWYMGLYPQLILVGIYFSISRAWKPRKWIFHALFPVSAVVFLLEYLNRFDIYPIDMGSYGPSFISTIGNINWYCGYQVSVFFAGMILLWQGVAYRMWQRLLLMAYVLLGFASLVTQGSSSGMFAMAAVTLVMFCMSVSDSGRMYRFWQEMVLFGGACLLTFGIQVFTGRNINYKDDFLLFLSTKEAVVFLFAVSMSMLAVAAVDRKRRSHLEGFWRTLKRVFVGGTVILILGYSAALIVNTLHPGSIGALSENPAFLFSNAWASNRGATWKAAMLCFLEQDFLHKLTGVGPDAMKAYIYNGGSPKLLEIVETTFGTTRLTNAHNEWLTALVDTGVLGLVSYVGWMASGMVRFLKERDSNLISRACGFCLFGFTANNIFSFQQSMSVATVFVIFGMGEAFYRNRK